MIVPPGITVNIGRKEYREGMELPADAPDHIKKHCADHAAKLAKEEKNKSGKPDSNGNPPQAEENE